MFARTALWISLFAASVSAQIAVHVDSEAEAVSFRLRSPVGTSECSTPCDLELQAGSYAIEQMDSQESWRRAGTPIEITRDSFDLVASIRHEQETLGIGVGVLGGVLTLAGGLVVGITSISNLSVGGLDGPAGLTCVLGAIGAAAGIGSIIAGFVLYNSRRLSLDVQPPLTFSVDPYAGGFIATGRFRI